MSSDRWYAGQLSVLDDAFECLRRLEDFLDEASGNLDGPGKSVTDLAVAIFDADSGRKVKEAEGVLVEESGVLTLSETTTPTAKADYGKLYTKNDNKLYFQDGAGTEHEVQFV